MGKLTYDSNWGLCKQDCTDKSPETTNQLKEAQVVLFSPNGEPGLSIGLVFSCSLTDFLTATYRTDYRVAIVIKDIKLMSSY